MAVTAVCLSLQPFSIGAITTVPLLAIAAFGQSIAWPNVAAIISRNAEWEHQGQYLGLNNAMGALARVIGPFALGMGFTKIGVDAPFYMAGRDRDARDLAGVEREAQALTALRRRTFTGL